MFPKSRYDAPITIELNNRRIFCKGSNWVNPELYWGDITDELYETQIKLAADCHMNIFRMWGGAGAPKKSFYDICDRYGILIWQEFMLACNEYRDVGNYMQVLESEASGIIRKFRHHPCLAFWCGGNELFNSWSGMDDQSHPLRLLNKLCFELDYKRPFLYTSPLIGMSHGGYTFFSEDQGGDVFQQFQGSSANAYTEFGVPSISPMEALKKIIPENELDEITETPSWKLHHAMRAWMPESHACLETLSLYFGKNATVEERIAQSDWLQTEGLKGIFEEARRQWPHCSAALNWCFNEPWITAANCSIVCYPAIPKPGYFATKNALRGTMFSARIPHFDWKSGDRFTAQIWLLNDSNEQVSGSVEVILKIGDTEISLLKWDNAEAEANANTEGASVCFTLPAVDTDYMTLILKADKGMSSEYKLLYEKKITRHAPKGMNM
jgi:beta-mannosidase